MSIQEVYATFVEKTSKDFLKITEGKRARDIEQLNDRFYDLVNNNLKQKEEQFEV